MRAFLKSLDEKVWLAVEVGWTKPIDPPTSWDDEKIKTTNFNSQALNALFSAVLMRSLRRSHPLREPMKHGKSFKILMKVPRL